MFIYPICSIFDIITFYSFGLFLSMLTLIFLLKKKNPLYKSLIHSNNLFNLYNLVKCQKKRKRKKTQVSYHMKSRKFGVLTIIHNAYSHVPTINACFSKEKAQQKYTLIRGGCYLYLEAISTSSSIIRGSSQKWLLCCTWRRFRITSGMSMSNGI